MELTPIKIRGKRRRHDESPAASPLKRLKPKSKSKRKAKAPLEVKASTLEKKIPLEIMEQIFWLSGNCNLPRASPLIGSLLSSRSTLQMTFIRAFEPTWDHEWDVYGWRGGYVRGFTGDPALQSDILDCPWANISFILECWDMYVQRRVQRQEIERMRVKESTGDVGLNLSLFHSKIWGQFDDSTVNQAKNEIINCLMYPEKVRQCFFDDYAAFRRVEVQKWDISYFFRNERDIMTYCHVHRATRIPDSLLTMPLDDESLQKLFWLLRSGASLAADQTWELTLQTFHYAVPLELPSSGQLNLTVVRILTLLGAFEMWPRHILAQERDRITSLRQNILGTVAHPSSRKSWKLKCDYILSKLSESHITNPPASPRFHP
ncbi:hypothetical protein F4818DRAFT_403546 [Hypoxylon cercidicola]|nr:hypothetical protein F4818DRAFT_403546 [Hypoxylon cercidicola]